jgi:hypothetical protein
MRGVREEGDERRERKEIRGVREEGHEGGERGRR